MFKLKRIEMMGKKKRDYVFPEVRVLHFEAAQVLCGSTTQVHHGAVAGENDAYGGSFGNSIWD